MIALLSTLSVMAAAPTLGVPGLTVVGLKPELASFYTQRLAAELRLAGVKVTSTEEISALLGIERQRQLLGCSDDSSSCYAEMVQALGVDAVVTGSIAKVGDVIHISLNVTRRADASHAAVVALEAAHETEVVERLAVAAREIGSSLGARPPGSLTLVGKLGVVPAALALGAGLTGALLWAVAGNPRPTLMQEPPVPAMEAFRAIAAAERYQTVGIALIAVAGVALVTALLMFVLGREPG
jgi:hypothetical protein